MSKLLIQSVQWHITEVCPNRCKHCYIDDNKNKERKEQELSIDKLQAILDNLDNFARKYDIDINTFAITGGDPFEHPDFEKLLQELYFRGKRIKILGIPERVSLENILLLRRYHVHSYQVSLDGLKETHDMIRGTGSFEKTIKAIKLLQGYSDLQPHIMYTLHRQNYNELFPLIDYLVKEDIEAYFSFDFYVMNKNENPHLWLLDKIEVDNLLREYREKKILLKAIGSKLRLKEKVKLFATFDINNASEKFRKYAYISGCSCGINSIAILPNGDVLPCRRLPIIIGNLLEQSYEQLFLDNEFMRRLRRISSYKMCYNCDYSKICRGCPAIAYSMSGDAFGKMEYCNNKIEVHPFLEEPPLNCGRNQELTYVTNNLIRAIQEEGVEANLYALKYDIYKNLW